jgi:hypothetical protein
MSNNLEHDILSAISAMINAMDLIKDEWKKNPELVDRIIPLSIEKMQELQTNLKKYNQK